jgi:DNA/RNA-binding domain of Phe-tRNA-synthetase-like protein
MNDFTISSEIKDVLPTCRVGIIQAKVLVEDSSPGLLHEIDIQIQLIREQISIEEVSSLPLIEQNKNAYRILGKDPTRYRPSAEALTRRIIQGKGLYQVNNIVDLLNLVSIRTGYSIGGYDADKISEKIILSKGIENEPFKAIGRGTLNIHQLPVLRDSRGAFGSPTSDSERTMVRESTQKFLMTFFDFMSDDRLGETLQMSEKYLKEFGAGSEIVISLIE